MTTVTVNGTSYSVRDDGWCERLGCYVFRDEVLGLVTIPVD